MTVQPNLPNPSFADKSAYESDDELATSSSVASTSSSGVILGFDDGEIPPSSTEDKEQPSNDERKLAVSRLGGKPYFPLLENELPPSSLSQCPLCSSSMPLLTQIYAPLTDEQVRSLGRPYPRNTYREEFDRLLYVFGCIKKGCTGVRLLRAARRNDGWVKEGVENRRLAREEAQKKEEQRKKDRKVNPFAAAGGAMDNPFATPNPFSNPTGDFGNMIFGSSDDTVPSESSESMPGPATEPEKAEGSSVSQDFNNPSTSWPASSSSSSFPPRYLTTSYETLSSSYAFNSKQAQLAKKLAAMSVSNDDLDDPPEKHKGGRISKTNNSKVSSSSASSSSSGGNEGWSGEAYEVMRLSGVEEVFLAFQERLEASGAASQVVRYEFGGTPLPFQAKSKPYQLLYTSAIAPGTSSIITRAGHSASPATALGVKRYDASCSKLDRCPHCQSPRTFEMQLMPNLVTILERSLNASATDREEKELGWATVWCFTCSADCLDARSEEQNGEKLDWQGWREEIALVELEA